MLKNTIGTGRLRSFELRLLSVMRSRSSECKFLALLGLRAMSDLSPQSVSKRTSPTVAKPSRFATNMVHRREAEPPDMLGLDVDAVALPGRRLPLLKALRWNP